MFLWLFWDLFGIKCFYVHVLYFCLLFTCLCTTNIAGKAQVLIIPLMVALFQWSVPVNLYNSTAQELAYFTFNNCHVETVVASTETKVKAVSYNGLYPTWHLIPVQGQQFHTFFSNCSVPTLTASPITSITSTHTASSLANRKRIVSCRC